MDKDATMISRLESLIVAEVPGYERLLKEESGLMKFLNFFAQAFNDKFMTNYITTWYPKVYFPRRSMARSRSVWKVLSHEWIHLRNARHKTPVIHGFLYGLPQWLTLLSFLSLGAIWGGPWWLLNLIWLVLAAPIPAYFRAREELSAYVMSMGVNYWRYGTILDTQKKDIADQFTTSMYYFMWPFRGQVERWIDNEAQKLISGEYDNVTPYKEVKKLVEEIWADQLATLMRPPSP